MKQTPPQSALSGALRAETHCLQAAWQRHEPAFLDTYLVRDVEDPRINIQSILTRHFFLQKLFDDRYARIMRHEVFFALTVLWLLDLLKSPRSCDEINNLTSEVLDRLLTKDSTPKASDIPPFITAAFGELAFPNYIGDLLMWVPRSPDAETLPDCLLNTFQTLWAELLADEQTAPIRVLEAACGSANDYRFLDVCGLSRFMHYTGIDLSDKNIRNAKARFPGIDFQVGSVFDIPAEDKTFDYCFVHDLFEHLSPEGMDRAVSELYRVTTSGLCLHFFNMVETPDDVIQKKNGYHWNQLSSERMKQRLDPLASEIHLCRLGTWLQSQFAYPDYYNKNACTWRIQLSTKDPSHAAANQI